MDLLTWAIVALVVAAIAGTLGFTGIARGVETIARAMFALFFVVALILFLMVLLGFGLVT
ncbi:DUF1328 domain-containing protein [filamentous cyanobacterium CCT1]|nr:DUF1328 domain-containing protein [filamentous cyanobacterium CCT1]